MILACCLGELPAIPKDRLKRIIPLPANKVLFRVGQQQALADKNTRDDFG